MGSEPGLEIRGWPRNHPKPKASRRGSVSPIRLTHLGGALDTAFSAPWPRVSLGWELSSEDSKMPKMKTKRAAAKRFKATGGGRIRRSTAGKQHLMRGKSANRMRKLKKNSMVDPADESRIRRLLPYEL